MTRKAILARLVQLSCLLALLAPAASALAVADFSGRIGRIDVRTEHADPAVYRNALVIRDEALGVVCAVAPGIQNYTEFLSTATAAMLAGKNVVIARGGAINGQYKCYQISITN